jgi:FtsH-binding integral membrane protein
MPEESQKPARSAPNAVMAIILVGAALVAILGTILPALIDLAGTPALILRLAFYGVAMVDVAVAFWLRDRIRKAQASRTGGAVQRQ